MAVYKYSKFRIYITDFREEGATSPSSYASIAYVSIYDKNNVDLCVSKNATYLCSSSIDGHEASNAFDGNLTTYWQSQSGDTTNWIEIDFDEDVEFVKFGIMPTCNTRDYLRTFYIEGYYNGYWYTLVIEKDYTSFSKNSQAIFFAKYLTVDGRTYTFPEAEFMANYKVVATYVNKDDSTLTFLGCTNGYWRDPAKDTDTKIVLNQSSGGSNRIYMYGVNSRGSKSSGNWYHTIDRVVWCNYNIPAGYKSEEIFMKECKFDGIPSYLYYDSIGHILRSNKYTTDKTITLPFPDDWNSNIVIAVVARNNVATPEGFTLVNNPDYGMNRNQKMYLFVKEKNTTAFTATIEQESEGMIEVIAITLKNCSIKYTGNRRRFEVGQVRINKIYKNIIYLNFASISSYDSFDIPSPGVGSSSTMNVFYPFDYEREVSSPHLVMSYGDNTLTPEEYFMVQTSVSETPYVAYDAIEVIPDNRGELESIYHADNTIIIHSDGVWYDCYGHVIENVEGKDPLWILRNGTDYSMDYQCTQANYMLKTLKDPIIYHSDTRNTGRLITGHMTGFPKDKYLYTQTNLLLGNNITIQEVNIDASDDVMFAFNFGEDDKGYVYNFTTEQWEETDSGVTKDVIESYVNCPIFDGKWKYRVRVMLTESGYFRSFLLKYQNIGSQPTPPIMGGTFDFANFDSTIFN